MRKACISSYGNQTLQVSLPTLSEWAANAIPRQAVRISPANVPGEYLLLIQIYIPFVLELLHEDSHSASPMPLVTLPVKD